jgi:hypothetical protein
MQYVCPDGSDPRGGIPGARSTEMYVYAYPEHTVNQMNETKRVWVNTGGANGFNGGTANDVIKGGTRVTYNNIHENKQSCAEMGQTECEDCYDYYACTKPAGSSTSSNPTQPSVPQGFAKCAGNGEHGKGGKGGSFFKLDENNQRVFKKDPYTFKMSKRGLTVDSDTSIGNGTYGLSGGGGGGGSVDGMLMQWDDWDKNTSSPKSKYWIHAGSGGHGGCGGHGGLAGGTGATVIGMQLTPPSLSARKLELNVTPRSAGSYNILDLTPGIGGNGQPGQSGRYGGWRGDGGLFEPEEIPTRKRCLLASGGGVGGTGGGGGGGAAGLAGQAIGVAFVLNQSQLADAGYRDDMTSDEKVAFLAQTNINIGVGTYLYNIFRKPEEYIVTNSVHYGGDGFDGYGGDAPKSREDANHLFKCDSTNDENKCIANEITRDGNQGFGGEKPATDKKDIGNSIYRSTYIVIDPSYGI